MNATTLGPLVVLLLAACGGATEPGTAPSASAPMVPAPAASSAETTSLGAPSASAVASTLLPSAPPDPMAEVVDPKPTNAGAPAPLYAELFKKGAAWKVSIQSKHSGADDTGKQKTTQSKASATCTVTEVKTEPWGVVSHVECPDIGASGMRDPLNGWWIATSVGLFYSDEQPVKAPRFARRELVVAASPTAAKLEVKQKEEGFGEVFETLAQGAGWCRSNSSWGGDEGWKEVCVEAKKGFVSGKWGWAGGSSDENDFTAKLTHP